MEHSLVGGPRFEIERFAMDARGHTGPEAPVVGGKSLEIATDPPYGRQRVEHGLGEAKIVDGSGYLPSLNQPRTVPGHAGQQNARPVQNVDVVKASHEQAALNAGNQFFL